MGGPTPLLVVAAAHPAGNSLLLRLLPTLAGEDRARVAAAVNKMRELLLTTAAGQRVVAAV